MADNVIPIRKPEEPKQPDAVDRALADAERRFAAYDRLDPELKTGLDLAFQYCAAAIATITFGGDEAALTAAGDALEAWINERASA